MGRCDLININGNITFLDKCNHLTLLLINEIVLSPFPSPHSLSILSPLPVAPLHYMQSLLNEYKRPRQRSLNRVTTAITVICFGVNLAASFQMNHPSSHWLDKRRSSIAN